MVDFIHEDLFRQSSIPKELIITDDGEPIENIVAESFSLNEAICKEGKLVYGSLCASTISFSFLHKGFLDIVGHEIVVKMMVDDDDENLLDLGTYYIVEDKLSNNRKIHEIKAENALVGLLYKDVKAWYEALTFPMTVKSFRDSFFDYVGIDCVEKTLVNDSLVIGKTLDLEKIEGSLILSAIAEINCAFGRINRENKFEFVTLEQGERTGTYPSDSTYPSTLLFPGVVYSVNGRALTTDYTHFDDSEYFSVDYANYKSNSSGLTNLQIVQDDLSSPIYLKGADVSNCYVIDNNFLLYGKTEQELRTIGNTIYDNIKDVKYTPIENAIVKGNPCLEPGDRIDFVVDDEVVTTYILERKMSGISSLKDNYTARGVESYNPTETKEKADYNRQFDFLRSRVFKLEQGGGGGGVQAKSVQTLPTNPDPNIIFLIQGIVVVN